MRRPSRQGMAWLCYAFTTPLKEGTSYAATAANVPGRRGARLGVFLLCVITQTLQASGQPVAPDTLFRAYFDAIRDGRYPAATPADAPSYDDGGLSILQRYAEDSVISVASKACEVIARISLASNDTAVRRMGAEILLESCGHSDPSVSGLAAGFLREYLREDFTPSSQDILRRLVRSGASPLETLMKLAGYLDMKDLSSSIRTYHAPGSPPSRRWAALISLSRMGDTAAVDEMMRRVKRFPVDDDVVYEIFPDLLYTRRREAFAHVVTALRSDQKDCLSADPERATPVPCGYRIMEQLAPFIEDFPLRLNGSGDLVTSDYQQALAIVREWLSKRPDYTIINNSY